MAEEDTKHDINDTAIVLGCVLTLVASPCLIAYVLFKSLWVDWKLREWWTTYRLCKIKRSQLELDSSLIVSHERNNKRLERNQQKLQELRNQQLRYTESKKFLNCNTRLLIAFELSCLLEVINYLCAVFMPINPDGWGCIAQAMMLQFTDWLVLNYNLAIATWIFMFICCADHLRSIRNRNMVALELFTHMACVISALVWVAIPLSTYPWIGMVYGPSGPWCWMVDNDHGKIWRMLGFYVPLWIVIALVAVLYSSVLMFVGKMYYTVRVHEGRSIGSSRSFVSRFGSQMFRVIRSNEHDHLSIRMSAEWKAYIKSILYPTLFLIIWISPTANRVLEMFGTSFFPIKVLHSFSVPSHGFFAAIIYPIDPIQLLRWLRGITTCTSLKIGNGDDESYDGFDEEESHMTELDSDAGSPGSVSLQRLRDYYLHHRKGSNHEENLPFENAGAADDDDHGDGISYEKM